MSGRGTIVPQHRLALAGAMVGVSLVVAGLAVLLGWAFDVAILKSLLPGLQTMKANTAAAFVLLGASLYLSIRSTGSTGRVRRTAAQAPALLAGALGLSTLGQYALGWNLGIDQLLFAESEVAPGTVAPGRMAVMTAVNIVALSLALLLEGRQTKSGKRPANWLALFVATNSFLAVLGYAFGVTALYQVVVLTAVALPTALLFLVACLGLVLARPGGVFLGRCLDDSPSGEVIRRLLPAAIVISPLLAWIRWQGELAGYYSTEFGLALYATSNVALFSLLVWWRARAVQHTHEKHVAQSRISDWQEAMLDSADLTVISTGVDGVIRTINAGAARNLGYAWDEVVGEATPALIHDPAEVAARAEVLTERLGRRIEPGFEAFVALARLGQPDENDWTYVRKDGSRFPVRLSVTALRNAEGDLTGFVGIGRDLTLQRLAEQALRESEERLRLITDNLPVLISYVDSDRRFRFNNRTYSAWLGKPLQEITGRRLDEVYDRETYALIEPHIERAFAGFPASFEFRSPHSERFVRGLYLPRVDAGGQVVGVYGLVSDVSAEKAAEARLRQMAEFDSLTGLANRFQFDEKLGAAIARSDRSNSAMALIFLDVDHFKAINDTFGHAAGDQVLREIGQRLKQTVRQTDTVARLSGDEFVVILESLAQAVEARAVAGKICEAMAAPFMIEGAPRVFSASMGVALRRPGEDGAAMMHRADEALYQVKGAGRGTFSVAE